jgi:hypothetical protein
MFMTILCGTVGLRNRLCLLWFVLKGWRVFSGVRSQADGETLQQLHSGITPVIIDVTS